MPTTIQTGQTALTRERAQIERRIADLSAVLHRIGGIVDTLTDLEQRLPTGREPLLAMTPTARVAATRLPRGALRAGILAALAGPKDVHITEILDHLAKTNRSPGAAHPRGSVQTTLYALRSEGAIQNNGRNRWARVKKGRSR